MWKEGFPGPVYKYGLLVFPWVEGGSPLKINLFQNNFRCEWCGCWDAIHAPPGAVDFVPTNRALFAPGVPPPAAPRQKGAVRPLLDLPDSEGTKSRAFIACYVVFSNARDSGPPRDPPETDVFSWSVAFVSAIREDSPTGSKAVALKKITICRHHPER